LQEIAHLIKVSKTMPHICFGDGSPFQVVAVDELRPGQASNDPSQFPCQIVSVLNAGVEPKPAGGRQAVSCVTCQKHPPSTIGSCEHGRHSPGSYALNFYIDTGADGTDGHI